MDNTEVKGQGIQSVELGLGILKRISAERRPLTVTEISTICGIPKVNFINILLVLHVVDSLKK